ncbi:hypothetical protein ACA910_002592 [Epithemia clementina (nom. ined.)]
MKRSALLFCAAIYECLHSVTGLVGKSGICSINVFTPFTNDRGDVVESIGQFGQEGTVLGFLQMASALMAAKHFNARDPSVVPRLANMGDCNVTVDISNTSVINTVPPSQISSQKLYQSDQWPCAGVGPASSVVGMTLSAVAQAAQFPLVITRVYNLRSIENSTSSFSCSVYPDLISYAEAIASFLLYKARSNYVALIYERTDVGIQRLQALGAIFDKKGIEWFAKGYSVEIQNSSFHPYGAGSEAPLQALEAVKRTGYRTIVIAMENVEQSFQEIAVAAEQLEMDNGDYFYMWYDQSVLISNLLENNNRTKLVNGSALVFPFSGFLWNDTSSFETSWKEQGQDLVDAVNAANPIGLGETGYIFAESDFFQNVEPGFESSVMYDAVMSVGLGACDAAIDADGTISGARHQQSILDLSFMGATGLVRFGSEFYNKRQNARLTETVTWGAVNLNGESWNISDVSYAGWNLTWLEVAPFRYADGTLDPPLPLRAPGKQNYISTDLRVVGLIIISITILGTIASMLWLFIHRRESFVASAKPVFHQIICFGIIVEVSSVACLLYDEGAGWSEKSLDSLCVAHPWFSFAGLSMQYTALFAKLWRVHEFLFVKKRKIEIKHLAGGMAVLQLLILIVLSIFTGIDPPGWKRRVVDNELNDSVGYCTSNNLPWFMTALLLIVFIQMTLTAITTLMIRKADEFFPETWWILLMVAAQLEAVLVAVPVILILEEQAAVGVGRVGFFLVIWLIAASTLGLFIIPTILAFRRAKSGNVQRRKRGEVGGVRVTGLARPDTDVALKVRS